MSDKLTLVVAGSLPAPPPVDDEPRDDLEEHGKFKDWLTGATKDVDLAPVKKRLTGLQSQIEGLLGSVRHSAAGMKLETVEVSIAITAEGSLGIVTAGTQASLTLIYALGQQASLDSL